MSKLNYTDMLAHLGISAAHPGGSRLTKQIFSSEQIDPEMKILEVGCGTGKTTVWLAKSYSCQITAIEPHQVMYEKAMKRFNKEQLQIKLEKESVEQLSYRSQLFDLIIAESVLSFTNTNQSIAELYRVLKNGGKLITIDMVSESQLSKDDLEEIRHAYGITEVLSEAEWVKRFRQTGFSNIQSSIDQGKNDSKPALEENDPSPYIDPQLFSLLQKHGEMLQKFQTQLGYRIFHCLK